MNTAEDSDRSKAARLIELALGTSSENEAKSAWVLVLPILKRNNVGVCNGKKLWSWIGPKRDSILWFGKHKGRRISWVYENDREYLEYLWQNTKNKAIRSVVAEWVA